MVSYPTNNPGHENPLQLTPEALNRQTPRFHELAARLCMAVIAPPTYRGLSQSDRLYFIKTSSTVSPESVFLFTSPPALISMENIWCDDWHWAAMCIAVLPQFSTRLGSAPCSNRI